MISIRSNKDLKFFPSYVGRVTINLDSINHIPKQRLYEMKLSDVCTKSEIILEPMYPLDEESQEYNEVEVDVVLGAPQYRTKIMTYEELDQLEVLLNISTEGLNKREEYAELFRQGLLVVTQLECMKGEGMYFSDAQDWEIVR